MKLINRDWYNQRNNRHNPGGTCFPTALACMISPFVDPAKYEGKQLEDWFWEIANEGAGRDYAETLSYARFLHGDSPSRFDFFTTKTLNTVWDVQCFVGNYVQNKVKFHWMEAGNFDSIIQKIKMDSPVIVQLKSTNTQPIDHILCIVGYSEEENTFLVMDSYGNACLDYHQYYVFPFFTEEIYKNHVWGRLNDLQEMDFILSAYPQNGNIYALMNGLSQSELQTLMQIFNRLVIDGNTLKYSYQWLMQRLTGNPVRMMWYEAIQ